MAVRAKIVAVFGEIFWGGIWRVLALKVAVSNFDLLETLPVPFVCLAEKWAPRKRSGGTSDTALAGVGQGVGLVTESNSRAEIDFIFLNADSSYQFTEISRRRKSCFTNEI